jgi:hypothetical protein
MSRSFSSVLDKRKAATPRFSKPRDENLEFFVRNGSVGRVRVSCSIATRSRKATFDLPIMRIFRRKSLQSMRMRVQRAKPSDEQIGDRNRKMPTGEMVICFSRHS